MMLDPSNKGDSRSCSSYGPGYDSHDDDSRSNEIESGYSSQSDSSSWDPLASDQPQDGVPYLEGMNEE